MYQEKILKKKLGLSLIASTLAALAHGAVIDVKSGDVAALTNALAQYKTSAHTIQLEEGDYDLSGIQMEEEGSAYGKSHLVVSGVKIVGMGASREKVRLIGDGTCRVYRMIADTYASLRNLTITNGYAKSISGAQYSGNGGGIYGYPTVTNCLIIGCKADGNGGGACHYTYIWDSHIINNTAAKGGGVFQANYVRNSLVRGNYASSEGGGIHGNDYGSASETDVIENSSGGYGGGISKVGTVSNCVVALNTSVLAGGGLYASSGTQKTVYDCTICSNKVTGTANTASGAVYGYNVVRGEVFANYAKHGGGASYAKLTNVEVSDNYAVSYGGGLYNCNATNCVIRNNFHGSDGTGANTYASVLYGCDISGTGVNGGRAINCDFHDITQNNSPKDNPYVSDASWSGHIYSNIPVCTNCLFRNNILTNYSLALFCGVGNATRSGSVVNCTIVSNKYGKTFSYMTSETYPVYVKNCVFIWNQGHETTSFRDIHAWENVSSNGLRFANCAYGTATGLFASGKISDLADSSDGPMYKFGANGFPVDPKFAFKDAAHPFEPKRTSPLRRIGMVEDWMMDGMDIRGEGYPRLRDGVVDIGCYQCWIQPKGVVISVR